MRSLFVAVALALVATPAAPAPRLKDAGPAGYFPTTVGARGVYQSGQVEETDGVPDVREDGGATIVVLGRREGHPREHDRRPPGRAIHAVGDWAAVRPAGLPAQVPDQGRGPVGDRDLAARHWQGAVRRRGEGGEDAGDPGREVRGRAGR